MEDDKKNRKKSKASFKKSHKMKPRQQKRRALTKICKGKKGGVKVPPLIEDCSKFLDVSVFGSAPDGDPFQAVLADENSVDDLISSYDDYFSGSGEKPDMSSSTQEIVAVALMRFLLSLTEPLLKIYPAFTQETPSKDILSWLSSTLLRMPLAHVEVLTVLMPMLHQLYTNANRMTVAGFGNVWEDVLFGSDFSGGRAVTLVALNSQSLLRPIITSGTVTFLDVDFNKVQVEVDVYQDPAKLKEIEKGHVREKSKGKEKFNMKEVLKEREKEREREREREREKISIVADTDRDESDGEKQNDIEKGAEPEKESGKGKDKGEKGKEKEKGKERDKAKDKSLEKRSSKDKRSAKVSKKGDKTERGEKAEKGEKGSTPEKSMSAKVKFDAALPSHTGNSIVSPRHENYFPPLTLSILSQHDRTSFHSRSDFVRVTALSEFSNTDFGGAVLSFAKGDTFGDTFFMVKAEEFPDGWAEGWSMGLRGYFPRTYVCVNQEKRSKSPARGRGVV